MSRTEEMTMIHNGRAAIYEYFTMCFHKPDDAEFIPLSKIFIKVLYDIACGSGDGMFVESAKEFSSIVEGFAGESAENVRDRINCGYTSLFLIGDRGIPVDESVYLSPGRLTKQEPWEDLLEIYGEFGFGVPGDMHISEEHLSAELLFMSFLAEKSSFLVSADTEADYFDILTSQIDFMKKHIMRWVPTLCKTVMESSNRNVEFFRTASGMLYAYLLYDLRILYEMMPESSDGGHGEAI